MKLSGSFYATIFSLSNIVCNCESGQVRFKDATNFNQKTGTPTQLIEMHPEALKYAFSRGSEYFKDYIEKLTKDSSQKQQNNFKNEILPKYLVEACKSGDIDMIKLLVQNHVDIFKISSKHKMSAISVALQRYTDLDILKALLNGKSVKQAGIDYSFFTECRNSKAYDQALFLLENGIMEDPQFYKRVDHSCVVWNYENNKSEWVKLLIKANVDLPPCCFTSKFVYVLRALLQHNLLHMIADAGDNAMLKFLISQKKVLSASEYRNAGIYQSNYFDISERDSAGRTPIEIAYAKQKQERGNESKQYEEITQQLIKLEALKELSNSEIGNILIIAANHADYKMIENIFETGVNIFEAARNKDSIMARIFSKVELNYLIIFLTSDQIAQYLDKYIPRINQHDSKGMTLLSVSLDFHNPLVFNWLIDHGADIQVPDIGSRITIAQKACHKGRIGAIETISNLKNFDPHQIDSDGNTLLHYVVAGKSSESEAKIALTSLIRNGVDVNSRNNIKQSALSSAVASNRPESAELLIKSGANISVTDKLGRPLLFAAIDHHNVDLVKILVDGGANVKEVYNGINAIDYSREIKRKLGTDEAKSVRKLLRKYESIAHKVNGFLKMIKM